MKITFVSNYINHHQIPTANCLYQELGDDYCFIQTQPMEAERVAMGWQSAIKDCPYLWIYDEQPELCKSRILESDIVIFGGVEDESYIKERLDAGKIVLRYCERFYKDGIWKAVSPRGLCKKYQDHTSHNKQPVYLLCAGGYVAFDFNIVGAYPNKKFKWGYFPETIQYSLTELFAKKQERAEVTEILWAGRFLDWKHPEHMIFLAEELHKKNVPFHITMVGGGELLDELQQSVQNKKLEDYVSFAGYLEPSQVRRKMEESNVFLFTSDFREGWGAVLNEAMNSACAVVAGHGIGAVPFLIQDGRNGLLYKNGDLQELVQAVTVLIQNPYMQKKLGENAYDTITTLWNAESAAKRLLHLCEELQKGEVCFEKEGPLSVAEPIAEWKMYDYLKNKDKAYE